VRRAQQLLAGIDTGSARRVGVFRDQPVAFLNEVAERCRLDLVQLHGHEPLDSLGALRVPAIAVIRVPTRSTAGQGGTPDAPAKGRGRGESLPATLARLTDTSVRGVPGIERSSWASSSPASLFGALIDAEDAAGRSGGLGLRAEPRALRRLLDELPETIRVFLSGGLSPENVGALVAEHRLFAVDVASGVEVAPGIKDAARMRAFVEAVEGAT
jgi:phosphoribosylanthranilate isomerase